MICADGLSGMKEAVAAAYPQTELQHCIVHQVRNTLKYVGEKNKKEFADAPQNILISLRFAPLHQDILHRGFDKRQYSIYTEKGKRATDQPFLPQSHFSAVDCFYRDFFAEPLCRKLFQLIKNRIAISAGIYVS